MFAGMRGRLGGASATRLIVLLAGMVVWLAAPLAGAAQDQACPDCVVYAAIDLNLRQDASETSDVLRTIPAGAELTTTGAAVDGYTPVTYDSVPGWVATDGIDVPSTSVGGVSDTSSATVDEASSSTVADESQRVTLAPLTLRSGPAEDAEPILVMPEGSLVTVTGEGFENGYITVDFDGEPGWAYADLLSEVTAP